MFGSLQIVRYVDVKVNQGEMASDQICPTVIEQTIQQGEPIWPGHVYRLQGSDGYYYIGSTQTSLERRLLGHRSASVRDCGNRAAVTIHFSELGWDNVTITSVQAMISTRAELHRAEGDLIKQCIHDPLCLNERITGVIDSGPEERRECAQEEVCECGASVQAINMPRHLLTQRHHTAMGLKILAKTTSEDPQEHLECECGAAVRRGNMGYHVTTDKHIWALRINLLMMIHQPKPVPPPIPQPVDAKSGSPHCQCECGEIFPRKIYSLHIRTRRHWEAMISTGLVEQPKDDTEEILEDKVTCSCGAMCTRRYLRFHQSTQAHILKLRLTEQKILSETSSENESPMVIQPTKVGCRVICDCGMALKPGAMTKHLETSRHAQWLQRKLGGKTVLTGTEREKEIHVCACSTRVTRGNLSAHLKTKKHLAWVEAQAVSV